MWREDRWNPLWIYAESSYLFFYIIIRRSVINLKTLSIGIACIGFVQVVFWVAQLLYSYPYFLDVNRMGFFDNAAGFSASIVCSIPYVLFLMKYTSNKKVKVLCLFLAIVFLTVLIIIRSRSSIVALCAILVLMLLLKKDSRVIFLRKRQVRYIGVLFLIVFFMLLWVLYMWKQDSAEGRLLIWICTKNMIFERPIVGYGVGGFMQSYMYFQ